MKGRQVGRVNQPSKGEVPLVSGVLQRAAVRAVADKEVEATEEAESETLRESRFRHDFSQVGIDRGGLPPIQAKLTIGEPGNKYEQEADRVAAQVVQQINAPASVQSSKGQSVQRTEAPDEEEIQAKPEKTSLQRMEAISGGEASKDLESAINSARGGGQPLEAGLQRTMGQAMGADFSGVKVYTDAVSDKLNQSMQAKAFTTGPDVFFRQGAYDPGSPGGQELIAHELTHVVQQQGVSRNRSARMLMRAIRKDKLNVVGENHEESDERRQGEKDYCLEKAGKANYWTEREFAVRDFRPWDWMADKREKADPWELRIRHQVQMIYEMGINGASGVECWGDSLWNRLKGVEREVRNMELDVAGFQWKGVNGREKRKPLLLAVEKLVKCTEAVRQRENKKPNAEEKALMISNITVIENTIREGGNREYIDVEGTEDDLSRARSKAMYNAALARKSQRGVWKVGQAHVEDMNEERWNLAGEIELTSRNDFNDEYKRAIRGEVVEEKEEEEKKVEERERKEQEDRINMLKEMEEEEKKLKERKMKTRSNSETEMEERKEEVNEKEGASEKKSVKEERGEEEVRGKNKFRFEKYRRAGMKL